jgi:ribosomal protein S18 acetylase RimI-like enzyme
MKNNTKERKKNEKEWPGVVIRELEIDDIATVFHLGECLFQAREVPNLYRTWDEYEVISFFQGDTEFCLVAEVEERVVGFILGTTVTKSRSAWKYGLMAWLGVDPEFQRFGIATKLFNELRNLMLENGVRMMLVDTEADNEEALHFFKNAGFSNPEEHLYLSMNLTSRKKSRGKSVKDGRIDKKRT